MPAVSDKQRKFFAWAYHHPEQAEAEGKTVGMIQKQRREFAETSGKLPTKKRKYYGEQNA